MTVAVIIPFRQREANGKSVDPLRMANLERIVSHWGDYAARRILVTGDGRTGNEQFNRGRAFNLGVADVDADVFVFAEADVLIGFDQIDEAVELATAAVGMVVPFTVYHPLSPEDSERVRQYEIHPADAELGEGMTRTAQVHGGALTVVSRDTYTLTGGFDEAFEGNWYDDDAAKIAFEVCAGPTRWVQGPVYHLYHLPGHTGDHLTTEDKMATLRNRLRLKQYRAARTPEQIRQLTANE